MKMRSYNRYFYYSTRWGKIKGIMIVYSSRVVVETNDENDDVLVGSYSNGDATSTAMGVAQPRRPSKRKILSKVKKKVPQSGMYGVVTSFSLLYYSGCL